MRPRGLLVCLVVAGCTATTGDTTSTSGATTSSVEAPRTTTTGPPTTHPELRSSCTESPSETPTCPQEQTTTTVAPEELAIEAFPVPGGSRPHDVAPAVDGGIWYTAQAAGALGWLDPETGATRHIALGPGSRPHGVIVDEHGTPWITDGGLNAIVSVDPDNDEVTVFPLPESAPAANLNTAVFGPAGTLWFTGQAGFYGYLEPATGEMEAFEAPRGRGPYGITATPAGDVYYASLAGSYVGSIITGVEVEVLEPPTPDQGARRVWADSSGDVWVSEWDGGNVSRYQPDASTWDTWPLPGADPATYAVYVDENDIVWLSDFGANAMMRFDPMREEFTVYPLPHDPGEVRQIHGRPGEVWGAESAADHLVLIRTG
jgi:virginiamycin B lyase